MVCEFVTHVHLELDAGLRELHRRLALCGVFVCDENVCVVVVVLAYGLHLLPNKMQDAADLALGLF